MLLKDRMDELPLDADPFPVDDAYLAKAEGYRLVQVFLDDDSNLPWLKRMQIDGVPDWDFMHLSRI
jgi:hypothetical protein